MSDPIVVVILAVTFLLAGCVKGVIGFGLPTVSLALLTASIGLQSAMALLLVPSLVTNLWQAMIGGNGRTVLTRTWPFLLTATAMIWFGVRVLIQADVSIVSAFLGALLLIYAMLGFSRLQISVPRNWEPWAGPLIGALNGLLAGMTGSFVVPGALYLQAIDLPRDVLVQAMGILFTVSTVGLAVALGARQLLTAELAALSAAAVVPAICGMIIGQRLRRCISELAFRRVFLISLAVLGSILIAKELPLLQISAPCCRMLF